MKSKLWPAECKSFPASGVENENSLLSGSEFINYYLAFALTLFVGFTILGFRIIFFSWLRTNVGCGRCDESSDDYSLEA